MSEKHLIVNEDVHQRAHILKRRMKCRSISEFLDTLFGGLEEKLAQTVEEAVPA